MTGSLQFGGVKGGSRTNVTLTVMRTSRHGPQTYGWWSNAGKVGGIRRNNRGGGALPQIQEKRVLRITSRLSDPFLMRREGNGTEFEGFCADLASALCAALPMECHLYETPDGRQGDYDPRRGTWDGMIGEIVTGRADLAVGDLSASAGGRAVDFLEPFLTTSLSLVMSRPSPPLLPSLSWGVWGAAGGAALLCGLLLHCLGRLSGGAPDSIEASSAIWERRLTPLMSAWLTLGSALLQPTGVYPRSLSSRVLAGSWWAFTGFLGCMLVASMTAQLHSSDTPPQLRQLRALSLEAILAEALENGWPEIGVVSPSSTEDVIQESSVPLLVRLRERVRRVRSEEEGAALAQEGGFALLTHSAWAERAAARRPCRLVAVHGSDQQGALAVALAPALEPAIKEGVRRAFESLHISGYLGHLHRKWWIDNSQCKDGEEDAPVAPSGGVSSLLIFVGAALLLLLLSFGVQLSRRIRTKESRRQQLTFEDINFDQRLPTPPPEMLAPPPVLEVPQIEGARSEESFKDFFDRMRTTSS